MVKLFAQHGSTFPLFSGHPCSTTWSRSTFVQQRSTCWAHARAVPSVSKNCHDSFASFPCRLQCPRSWALSLCCYRILYCFYAESTLLFYHVVFLPFCPHQWVRLPEVQPSLLFWGDEYTSDSQPCFNMSLCKILGMLNMLSHCWGQQWQPARQHLNKHSTCSELVQWTNPMHLQVA